MPKRRRYMLGHDVHADQIRRALAFKFGVDKSRVEVIAGGNTLKVEVDQHNMKPYRIVRAQVAIDMHGWDICAAARTLMSTFGMEGSITDAFKGPRGGLIFCRDCKRRQDRGE